MTGGGSGGHITPILAVAHELKQLDSKTELIYIGQTGDSLGDIPAEDENIDRIFTVRAGKFRRYHTEGIRQLFDFGTLFKNLRDIIWVIVGLWQSFWLLGRIKPDVIFVKGGFVGVPVGLAAALRRIPYITHDSDALPGLANRIIAPWAKLHTVALPKEVYTYPAQKTVTVGVPISHNFKKLSAAEVQEYRQQLKLNEKGRVLLVTGGGLGARRLNDAVITCATDILERYPDLQIVHIAGRALETEVRQQYKQELIQKLQQRTEVKGYINNIYKYSGAADVIVTRAGGTAVAEFAAQAKPIVVVPNPLLAGGHQLKNARVLADRKAVKLVSETHLNEDHHALMPALTELLDNPARAKELGQKLSKLAQPDAARKLAVLLLDKANNRS
jgi:UDP-N-acetylglucosamine--N-acetylmuramyl-(pentapeptide) pyrophosphoryl-undecaprenol N-acetylglucosamine transferase